MPKTAKATGTPVSQKSVCPDCMFRRSDVFIPKYEVTKERGRKMIVVTVKTRMALLLDSDFSDRD